MIKSIYNAYSYRHVTQVSLSFSKEKKSTVITLERVNAMIFHHTLSFGNAVSSGGKHLSNYVMVHHTCISVDMNG